MNYYAALYLDFAKRFEAPLDRYLEFAESVEATVPARDFISRLQRGRARVSSLRRYRDITPTIRCAWAVSKACAARRCLPRNCATVVYRSDQMAEEVSSAELRNPFDGKPFEWSADEQAVVYVGPDAERSRKRHPYFY